MKRLVGMILSIGIIIIAFGTPVFSEGEFEGREDEFQSLCSNWTTYNQNKETCVRFKSYLQEKRNEADKDLDVLKGSIADIKGTLNEDNAALRVMQEQIETLTNQVNQTKQMITEAGERIEGTQVQIVEKETDIAGKETKVSTYMINLQGSMRVNSYIEFVMGSKNFADVSRRLAGINSINEYNQKLIQHLNEEKVILEDKKKELEFNKEELEQLKVDQEHKVAQQNELAVVVRQRVIALEDAYQNYLSQQEALLETQRLTDEKIDSINVSPPSNSMLVRPIESGFYISAAQWAYPYDGDALDGKKHLGVDMAASTGTALRAPGTGVVVATYNGCATTGSFGCGYGFGNYILMIVSANGKIYGSLYGHLQKDSFTVSVGQTVAAGQKVAAVGNSGTSYGSHSHVELYYLGDDSVSEAYNRWYDRGANMTFNTYSSGSSLEYSRRCMVNGNTAPCRLNAADEYGVELKHRY